jgi:hypothetical protein
MTTFDPQNYPFIREIKSPLTSEQLSPLDQRCRVVQFASSLTDSEHIKLAEFLRAYPDVPLRVYGHYGLSVKDLGFLCYYSFLKGFQVDLWQLETTEGIEFLPSTLEFLAFGQTKSKKFSLRLLSRFPRLKELHLEGHTKDFDVVDTLKSLERLTIRSITLPDLSWLTSLHNLWWLAIKLGGTRNLDLLPRVGRLKYLELWMIRGLTNIEAISKIETLQYLFLQDLKNVTKLPSFKRLQKLKRLGLDSMKGITDLSPLNEAAALEQLLVVSARQLQVEDFKPLVGHSSLKRASVGLCSIRKNEQVERLLGLPPVHQFQTQLDYN